MEYNQACWGEQLKPGRAGRTATEIKDLSSIIYQSEGMNLCSKFELFFFLLQKSFFAESNLAIA